VEELVSDVKKAWFAAAIAGIAMVPSTTAGAAWWLRGRATSERDELVRLAADLQQRVERERERTAAIAAAPAVEPAGSPWRLHEAPDVAGVMQWLQGAGDATGVAIDAIKAVPDATAGRQSFTVVGQGAPHQVCAWLAAIERRERLVVVESGRVTAGDPGRVVVELAIAAWHAGASR
jgi:hypothetical protein